MKWPSRGLVVSMNYLYVTTFEGRSFMFTEVGVDSIHTTREYVEGTLVII